MKKTLVTCLLVLLLSLSAACAETATFLPDIAWNDSPMELTLLQVTLNEHQPFDEIRTGWLNDLLRHITLTLRMQTLGEEAWSQMSLQVDNSEVIGMTQRVGAAQSQLQTTLLPDVTYTLPAGQGTALETLLGATLEDGSLYGLDGTESAWLSDGEALLYAVQESYAGQITDTARRETITGFTTVARRKTLTIAKDDAETFRQSLLALCPEGQLHDLIASLTFSSKQTLVLNTLENGTIVQAKFTGQMGVDSDHMRSVTITWKMLRKDYLVKDDLTVKSPTLQGKSSTDYNTLTYTRKLTEEGDEAVLASEFSYKRRENKLITTTTGKAALTRTTDEDGLHNVQGTITLTNDPPLEEEDNKESTALTLDLDVDAVLHILSGHVNVVQKYNKKLQEDADLTVLLIPCETFGFTLSNSITALDTLDADTLASLQETLQKRATAVLVRPLVLLPREETYYFSYGLPDENWQQIVEAAQSVAP